MDLPPVTLQPIGIVRTPFTDKVSAPRQPYAGEGVEGRVELAPGHGFEHALEDLEGWDRLWILFLFDRNEGWRPKVLPPRSTQRRGVFSTRAPHRPNPIGMSVVRLVRVEGLVVHVRDLDILDGTPVLDLKPYAPMADAFPDARTGWLEETVPELDAAARPVDRAPPYQVEASPEARAQLDFLSERGEALEARLRVILSASPHPHPYRRIRREGDAFRIAVSSFRALFRVEGRRVTVLRVASGYRPSQLATDPALALHRDFVERFG
jgi:tRNA (adenine37-N6)-methyltransferase